MANKSLFDRLRNAYANAGRRVRRREEAFHNEPYYKDIFTPLPEYVSEAMETRGKIGDALHKETLNRDIANATGDGKRFVEEVVNFVGPRQQYKYDYKAPRHVRQKDIRHMADIMGAYNLNEIPGSIQDEFLDRRGYAMKPEETMYSTGVYGLNGKYFQNCFGDDFYVPNRSTEVFRR